MTINIKKILIKFLFINTLLFNIIINLFFYLIKKVDVK